MHYDYIIAGSGAAGLSLVLELIQSDLSGRSVLIIDRDQKNRNDRTWCFWSNQSTGLESIFFRSWSRICFIGESFDRDFTLGDYQYHMVRGIDFYNHVRQKINAFPNISWIHGTIHSIKDTPHGAQVDVDGVIFSADFVFDSILKPQEFPIEPEKYHYLNQHFMGWIIETSIPRFNPLTPILFDFRTPQNGAMRFMYTLPFSPNSALIEYTLFSAALLNKEDYELGLQDYIYRVLGIDQFTIMETEQGIIPMTDQVFVRKAGAHILNIGTKGGMVKPSSGFAFWRIHQDSKAIVHSLQRYHHPFNIQESPLRYRWFDTILLQIMLRHPDECAFLFTTLFKNNSIQSIFRFLNEEGGWSNDLKILVSLPPYRFLEALLKVKLLKKYKYFMDPGSENLRKSKQTTSWLQRLTHFLGWTRFSYTLFSMFVAVVLLIVIVWWPLVVDYFSQVDPDYPIWSQLDWLLIGLFAFMSLAIMAGANFKRDAAIAFIGICGGLVIESWGTQTQLWSYYTYERPPLWIIPAWPISTLTIDRMVQVILQLTRMVSDKDVQRIYYPLMLGFFVLMLLFVWPTLSKPMTILALFISALLICSPGNHRFALASFIAGSVLGYFLEVWGTTRFCWIYYTFQTPPLFAVLAHGLAGFAFWRAGVLLKLIIQKF